MAAQLKLREQARNEGATLSTLDLYANAAGFTIARGGWSPGVIPDGAVSIEEVITLHVFGSSHDDLATKVQNLKAKILAVAHRARTVSPIYEMWVIDQLPNETGARKASLFDARFEVRDSLHGPTVSPGNHIQECSLILVRGHWSADRSRLQPSGLSTLGGSDNYGVIPGDVPARLSILRWVGENGGGGPFYEFWTGFRTSRFGTVANFVPVWECEDGTLGTDASVDAASEVNTASPGGGSGAYVEVASGGTETMTTRLTINVEDVTANYGDQGGTFAVVLRAKVVGATTWRVRLLDGYTPSSNLRTRDRVEVTKTSWFCLSLGTVTIPPVGLPLPSRLRKYGLVLQAELTAGSGNLLLDAFVPVPMDEGFIHATGGQTQYSGGDTRPSEVRQFPDLTYDGVAIVNDIPVDALVINPEQPYGLPVGDGTLYVVAQREASHVLADTIGMDIFYVRQWALLRGSE